MARSLGPAKRAVVDSMGKDILKTARNGLSDKAFGVQRGAAEVSTIYIATFTGSHFAGTHFDVHRPRRRPARAF